MTNETSRTRQSLVAKLHRLGYEMPESEVFPPALAMAAIARAKNLRPHMLVHPNCLPDLGVQSADWDAADSVILGDAADNFSYANMNAAFRALIKSGGDLYTLGRGKYYREDGELTLDVGPYAAALEYAASKEAVVVGKPSKDFFHAALMDMRVDAGDAVMVGDDVVSDVGGAQAAGLRDVVVTRSKDLQCIQNQRNFSTNCTVYLNPRSDQK